MSRRRSHRGARFSPLIVILIAVDLALASQLPRAAILLAVLIVVVGWLVASLRTPRRRARRRHH
jgi:positive regulator of sigma E activity